MCTLAFRISWELCCKVNALSSSLWFFDLDQQLSDEQIRAECLHQHLQVSRKSPATVRRADSCWVPSSAPFPLVYFRRKYPVVSTSHPRMAGWILLPAWRTATARSWWHSWTFGKPGSDQARRVAIPHVQTTFQERTVGEAPFWRILMKKMKVLVLDLRLMMTVLVARAMLVN